MICQGCEKQFNSPFSKSKFCGTRCRTSFYNKKNRIKKAIEQGKEPKHKINKNCCCCNKEMKNVFPHKKYCNTKCKNRHLTTEYNFGDDPKISNSSIGAMHEMLVCADLLRRGYAVFRAISSSCPCDIAILLENKLLRVEVTTGNIRSSTGKVYRPKKDIIKFDLLAIVLKNGKIIYEPEFKN